MKALVSTLLLLFVSVSQAETVATVGMIADVARNVAGELVPVRSLIKPGVDPHFYKATRSDIITLRKAELILYNGLFLEGKLEDALKRIEKSGKQVVAVSERIDPSFLIEPEDYPGNYDPHLWMDPVAWKHVLAEIEGALSRRYPQHREAFLAQRQAYEQKLQRLSEYASRILNTVPQSSRILITAHDAFNYFGQRFGYEVVGIQGISTASEAGIRHIEELVNLIVERKVQAVFVESTVSQKNIEAIVEGARAKGHQVQIGGELFSDAMGKEGTYLGTYIGMIDHNVTTIARALGGQAPQKGLNGRL